MSVAIDADWRTDHPLPDITSGLDKEERGRVLLVGGSVLVPGAVLLTGEAVLRAGAGKLQIGTVETAAMTIAVAFPEAAVVGLPHDGDGELATGLDHQLKELGSCDALLIGPGMTCRPQTGSLVRELLGLVDAGVPVLLDAGAITALRPIRALVAKRATPAILTPHHGELAALMDVEKSQIAQDPGSAAVTAAKMFGAIVILKAEETFVADPAGELLTFSGAAPGLGTAGSGDVLAGIIGGFLARGAAPLAAAGHGVWIHAQAGCAAEDALGLIGYLARDLLSFIPRLVSESSPGNA